MVCGKETGAGCTIFTRPFFPLWKVEGRAGSKPSMPYIKKTNIMGCVLKRQDFIVLQV